jgi:hypothetical protein
MTAEQDSRLHRTALERRTAAAAVAATPVIAAAGVVSAIGWPEAVSGEADPTTGGVVAGTVAFVLTTAAPQLLFAWALRSGNARALTATAVAAPVWAVWFGLIPLAGARHGRGHRRPRRLRPGRRAPRPAPPATGWRDPGPPHRDVDAWPWPGGGPGPRIGAYCTANSV